MNTSLSDEWKLRYIIIFIIIDWHIKWHNLGFVSEGGKFLFLICMSQAKSKDKWYSFELDLLSYMSGLEDCGVISIFCFPLARSQIINYSNVFFRLTSFDSQVPKRQKSSHENLLQSQRCILVWGEGLKRFG